MIRINLIPQKRRKGIGGPSRTIAVTAAPGEGRGGLAFALMMLGWLGIAGAGWYLLEMEEEAAAVVRAQAADVTKDAKDLETAIDTASLDAKEADMQQQELAIQKLKAKQRTPAFVMYELASILTDASKGGGPTIDQEKYKQSVKDDPQSQINERWDPSGLWLTKVTEEEGRLKIEGTARDASDLAEFTRRLRASVWFGNITHPDYERASDQKDKEGQRNLTWKLDVAVLRWN
jgi:Tfp pilus assembly protein PilN